MAKTSFWLQTLFCKKICFLHFSPFLSPLSLLLFFSFLCFSYLSLLSFLLFLFFIDDFLYFTLIDILVPKTHSLLTYQHHIFFPNQRFDNLEKYLFVDASTKNILSSLKFRHKIHFLPWRINERSTFFVDILTQDSLSSPMFCCKIHFIRRCFSARFTFFAKVSAQDLISSLNFRQKIHFLC